MTGQMNRKGLRSGSRRSAPGAAKTSRGQERGSGQQPADILARARGVLGGVSLEPQGGGFRLMGGLPPRELCRGTLKDVAAYLDAAERVMSPRPALDDREAEHVLAALQSAMPGASQEQIAFWRDHAAAAVAMYHSEIRLGPESNTEVRHRLRRMRSALQGLLAEHRKGGLAAAYLEEECKARGIDAFRVFMVGLPALERAITAVHDRRKGRATEAINASIVRMLNHLAQGFHLTFRVPPTTTLDGPFWRAACGVVSVALKDEDREPDHRAVQKAMRAYREFVRSIVTAQREMQEWMATAAMFQPPETTKDGGKPE